MTVTIGRRELLAALGGAAAAGPLTARRDHTTTPPSSVMNSRRRASEAASEARLLRAVASERLRGSQAAASGSAVANCDLPIRDYFQKPESDLTRSSSQRLGGTSRPLQPI